MVFTYAISNVSGLKGFTNTWFRLRMIQTITTTMNQNLAIPVGSGVARSITANGLDAPTNNYAYESWVVDKPEHGQPYFRTGLVDDTPGIPLTGSMSFISVSDSFQAYLMFHPIGGVPVPLKVANWGWGGKALETNGTIMYQLIGTPTQPQPANGVPCDEPPQWDGRFDQRVQDDSSLWQTNTTYFPTN